MSVSIVGNQSFSCGEGGRRPDEGLVKLQRPSPVSLRSTSSPEGRGILIVTYIQDAHFGSDSIAYSGAADDSSSISP